MATDAPTDVPTGVPADAPVATPANGDIENPTEKARTVTEGKATILIPEASTEGKTKGQEQVFYNPIQQFNRDLSVLAIKTYGEDMIERRRHQFESRQAKQSRKRKRDDNDKGEEVAKQTENGDAGTAPESQPSAPAPATREYKSTFKILDALSASGLRALRYAHEIPFVTSVTANDLSASAAESIQANINHNRLQDKIQVNNDDALALMYRAIAEDLSKKDKHGNPGRAHKFDVVDLDPYGTAAPFFDAAVQAVRDDGGLLCITCTDSALWAGHCYAEKTFALYGGIPVHGGHTHEVGLRLILNAVASSASRYGLYIEPLLSLSIDFYTKFFIKVTKSQQAVKFLGAKTMLAYSCDGCGSYSVQHFMRSKPTPNKNGSGLFYKHVMGQGPTTDRTCEHCGFKQHVSGPMYAGPLHSQDFIQKLLKQVSKADKSIYGTLPRLEGMLQTALEEHLPGPEPSEKLPPKDAEASIIDHYPFYVMPARMAGALSCVCMPEDLMRGALTHLGYRVSRSHCKPGSIKTDAPWDTLWWIMTEWIRQRAPIKEANIKPTSAAYKILTDAGIIGQPAVEKLKGDAEKDGDDVKMEETSDMQSIPSEPVPVEAQGQAKEEEVKEEGDKEPKSEHELRKTLVFNDDLARLGRQGRHATGKRLVRYQFNPEKNWGPLTRAKAS
jgi:tRNA (guanine26-N2/guanine27-N2)-dimethyltransferase